MLLPFKQNSPEIKGTLKLIEQLRSTVDAEGPVPRKWAGRLRRELQAEAIAASTSIEGVAVTTADVLRILAGDDPPEVSKTDIELVRGYREAIEYAHRRADDSSFGWNRELLIAIHDRVLAGDVSTGAGRLRTGAVWVTRDGKAAFTAPDPDLVPELLDEMCTALIELGESPVTAAWAHVALAAIHPFKDGNGRTARILASLVMLRAGYRRTVFTSLEEWWGRHTAEYYTSFDCLGESFKKSADVTVFVARHLNAQAQQVTEFVAREQVDRALWTLIENILLEHGLSDRLANALWEAFFGRPVTAGYYRGMTDVSAATATNDLARATAAGLLVAKGERRARFYLPGDPLYDELFVFLGLKDRPANRTQWPQLVRSKLSERVVLRSD